MSSSDTEAIDSRILETLNSQLIQKNKEMEQLLARVAHELLTPITALILTSDDLLDHYDSIKAGTGPIFSETDVYAFSTRIVRSSADLKNQALNILNHFKSNSMLNKTTLVEIHSIVEELIDELKPLTDENKITITLSLQKQAVILAAEESIRTIIRNILSNAVKFTIANKIDNKLIKITLTDTGSSVCLIVKDSGIGMPASFFNSKDIFELGKRSSNAINKEVRGYGLGMNTTKHLIDCLGGSIHFDSIENEGTTVFLNIPKDQDVTTII